MVSDADFAALKEQVTALQASNMQLMARVVGNDPSGNFNPLGSPGGSGVTGGIISLGANGILETWDAIGTSLLGWIGTMIVGVTQFFGAWFKQLYVGGTDASNAPLFVDNTGNIKMSSTLVSDVNGVTTTLNGVSIGGFTFGLTVQDDVTNDLMGINSFGFVSQRAGVNTQPRFAMGFNVNAGILFIYDGNGVGAAHQQHVLDGLNGNYTIGGQIAFKNGTVVGPGGRVSAGFAQLLSVGGIGYYVEVFT